MKPKLYTVILHLFIIPVLAVAQYTPVASIPLTDVYSIYEHNDTLYAGTTGKLYMGKNDNSHWDSVMVPNNNWSIDKIVKYKNRLFIASYNNGVYSSADGGKNWANITATIFPAVTSFYEFKGLLYAGTEGGGVYKLNPVDLNSWINVNKNIFWSTAYVQGSSKVMVAGAGANGVAYLLNNDADVQWQEVLIKGTITPGLVVTSITSIRDSLYMGTNSGAYRSTDDGITWTPLGSLPTAHETLFANAENAIFAVRNYGLNNADFYYRFSAESSAQSWNYRTTLSNTVVYGMVLSNQKLWIATDKGLLTEDVSAIPGIRFAMPKDNEPDPTYNFSIGNIIPNPNKGSFSLAITLEKEARFDLSVYDNSGRFISMPYKQILLLKGLTNIPVKLSFVTPGIYFLVTTVEGKKRVQSFFIAGN